MRTRWIAIVFAAGLLAPACASDGGVGVDLDEYSVRAEDVTDSGRVEFNARNVGQIEHELVVLRTDRDPDDLPVKDAEVQLRSGVALVGKTPRIDGGEARKLVVRLQPGRYVLICNVPGHYQSGMRASLEALRSAEPAG